MEYREQTSKEKFFISKDFVWAWPWPAFEIILSDEKNNSSKLTEDLFVESI